MLEKTKTLVLSVLVLCSLFLTSQQWTASFAPIAYGPIGIDLHEPQPLDVLAPWVLYVHGPEGSALFSPGQQGFTESWALFRRMASGFRAESIRQGTDREWEALAESGALEFRLAGSVQLRMWLESLSVRPEISNEHFFNHVLISPDSVNIYFRDSTTSTYLIWDSVVSQEDVAEVFASVRQLEGQNVRRPEHLPGVSIASWVYVPSDPGIWRELWVKNERGRMTSIVNSFFNDLSLVRRVSELDGRTTFTDGRRVVWSYAYGGVEYLEPSLFRPLYDIQARASLVLSYGISFVSRRGGWPPERRLKVMEVVTDASVPYIDFEFITYYRDPSNPETPLIPLVSWRKEVGLRITEREVVSYERFVYTPERLGPWSHRIIPAEKALETAWEALSDRQITDMYLAYYQRDVLDEEFLYPVWVVEQGRERVFINAYTADLVKGS